MAPGPKKQAEILRTSPPSYSPHARRAYDYWVVRWDGPRAYYDIRLKGGYYHATDEQLDRLDAGECPGCVLQNVAARRESCLRCAIKISRGQRLT